MIRGTVGTPNNLVFDKVEPIKKEVVNKPNVPTLITDAPRIKDRKDLSYNNYSDTIFSINID